jgi:hypothetical protein
MDCSFPKEASVNLGIDNTTFLGEDYKLELPSVDRIISQINTIGRGALLFKRDLRRAYRQFPVDPFDWNYLGFSFKRKIYFDKRLTMGLRSAATGCQRATKVVGYIFNTRAESTVEVYLDDFNGIAPPILAVAEKDFMLLQTILGELGLEESLSKAVAPNTRVTMLGIMFDTLKMTMEVTPERVRETEQLTQDWMEKQSATKKEVQQLIGKLMFVSKCVRQSRVFLNRILNFLKSFNQDNSSLIDSRQASREQGRRTTMPNRDTPITATVSGGLRKDVKWFNTFLKSFNGISLIPSADWDEPDITMATDACLIGCGGTCMGEFFHDIFPTEIRSMPKIHISELEILTVCAAAKIWSQKCRGHRITLKCDNEASVIAINSGRCSNMIMQACLRELVFVACSVQCEFRAIHIRGIHNRLPDILSRWTIDKSFPQQWNQITAFQWWKEVKLPKEIFNFSHPW